jgi:hypothetical protein
MRTSHIATMILGLGIALNSVASTALAQGNPVSDVQVLLELAAGGELVVNELLKTVGGARGAVAVAIIPGDEKDLSKSASWLGDTGLIDFDLNDGKNEAIAQARNSLLHKVANAGGGNAHFARATLTWNGNIVAGWDHTSPPVLPNPSQVKSASLNIQYNLLEGDSLSASSVVPDPSSFRLASVQVSQQWDGVTTFDGAVTLAGQGPPVSSGGLVAYQDQFTNTTDSISAPNLTITDTAVIPIDYTSFYNSGGDVSASFSGRAVVTSVGVPEPSCLGMLAVGIVVLIIYRQLMYKTVFVDASWD